MSLLVTVILNDGIIMASDNRTTYTYKNKDTVKYVDTTNKTFLFDKTIGISHCRNAAVNGKSIEEHLKDFQKLYKGRSITRLPNLLRDYFLKLNPDCNVAFFIAGYENYKSHAYRIFTQAPIERLTTSKPCSYWEGERDVPSRLFSTVYIRNGSNYKIHSSYELAIDDFSIPDGIDFATFLIKTSEEAMKFQRTNKTVGGPIDILVIKPYDSYWYKRK